MLGYYQYTKVKASRTNRKRDRLSSILFVALTTLFTITFACISVRATLDISYGKTSLLNEIYYSAGRFPSNKTIGAYYNSVYGKLDNEISLIVESSKSFTEKLNAERFESTQSSLVLEKSQELSLIQFNIVALASKIQQLSSAYSAQAFNISSRLALLNSNHIQLNGTQFALKSENQLPVADISAVPVFTSESYALILNATGNLDAYVINMKINQTRFDAANIKELAINLVNATLQSINDFSVKMRVEIVGYELAARNYNVNESSPSYQAVMSNIDQFSTTLSYYHLMQETSLYASSIIPMAVLLVLIYVSGKGRALLTRRISSSSSILNIGLLALGSTFFILASVVGDTCNHQMSSGTSFLFESVKESISGKQSELSIPVRAAYSPPTKTWKNEGLDALNRLVDELSGQISNLESFSPLDKSEGEQIEAYILKLKTLLRSQIIPSNINSSSSSEYTISQEALILNQESGDLYEAIVSAFPDSGPSTLQDFVNATMAMKYQLELFKSKASECISAISNYTLSYATDISTIDGIVGECSREIALRIQQTKSDIESIADPEKTYGIEISEGMQNAVCTNIEFAKI